MMMHGTRIARPSQSSCGGAASSYHPPQSSHSTTMAVDFQYLLLPMALTTAATQDGPVSLSERAWSESFQSGTTQDTAARLPFAASPRIVVWGLMTSLAQSGP